MQQKKTKMMRRLMVPEAIAAVVVLAEVAHRLTVVTIAEKNMLPVAAKVIVLERKTKKTMKIQSTRFKQIVQIL